MAVFLLEGMVKVAVGKEEGIGSKEQWEMIFISL